MRPIWGSRSLFFARAFFGVLAALILVVWAVAAPRVLSRDPVPPSAAPETQASGPLHVSIGSFLSAKPSLSNKSSLQKHASGSYSSGDQGVETRANGTTERAQVAATISNAPTDSAREHSRGTEEKGGSTTPTNTTPAVTPTETTPVVTPTAPTDAAPVVTPTTPSKKPRTRPEGKPHKAPHLIPHTLKGKRPPHPRSGPVPQTPTTPGAPESNHSPRDNHRGYDPGHANAPADGKKTGTEPDLRGQPGKPSCDRHSQGNNRGPQSDSAGNGHATEGPGERHSNKSHR